MDKKTPNLKFRWRSKCAIFDYDWTIVRPKNNNTYPKDIDDWVWFRKSVKENIQCIYKKGFAIIIVTNQSKPWKELQIKNVVDELGVPVLLCIANEKCLYKPDTTLFDNARANKKLDLEKSFMVGDALGRVNDYSNVDRKFAEALNIKNIYSPEEFFPEDSITNNTEVVSESLDQEIVVMVGYPGSGKTTFCQKIFKSYFICSGDEHKTSAKMIKVANAAIQNGQSVVFDATNPSKEKRQVFIEYAKTKNLPIRCVHIATSFSESLIKNNERAKPVPKIVYNIYKSKFQEPSIDEGFYSVSVINSFE